MLIKDKLKILYRMICVVFFILFFFDGIKVWSDDFKEQDERAEIHFEKKEFNKAIGLWLNILYNQPENERIQKKIEMIYEIKQKKVLMYQKARLLYKRSKKIIFQIRRSKDLTDEQIEKKLKEIKKLSGISIASYIKAYRLDPNDLELQNFKNKMKQFEKDVKEEVDKVKVSKKLLAMKKSLQKLALENMENNNYKDALKAWKGITSFLPEDTDAIEGVRKCNLAIKDLIRYQNIKKFLEKGKILFDSEKYKEAKYQYLEVINIDESNREAMRYMEFIDDKLEEKKNYENKLIQAEEFYRSGKKYLKNYKFESAREDFENALAVIDNYKDSSARLKSIDKMRKKYLLEQTNKKSAKINKEFQDGIIFLSQGRYKDAIDSFIVVLNYDSKNIDAKKYLGQAKDARKQIEEEIVDRNSSYYDIVHSLIITGKILYKKKRYGDSMKKWDKIKQLFPKNKIAKEYGFRCFLKLNPEDSKSMIKKIVLEGKKYLKNKNYPEALKEFLLVKSVSKKYPGINHLIKKAQKHKGKMTNVFLTAAEKREINRRYRLGINFYRKGGLANAKKALVHFKWIAKKNPGHIKSIINSNKIETEFRLGKKLKQIKKIKLTAKQKKLIKKYYYNGINYYSNNSFQRAIGEWRKVLVINPGHIKAKNNIRQVLVILGR